MKEGIKLANRVSPFFPPESLMARSLWKALSDLARRDQNQPSVRNPLIRQQLWRHTTKVSSGASRCRCHARRRSCTSHTTHPRLLEAVGVSLLLLVLLLLGLLELVPQHLYPVVVTGDHLPAGGEGSSA